MGGFTSPEVPRGFGRDHLSPVQGGVERSGERLIMMKLFERFPLPEAREVITKHAAALYQACGAERRDEATERLQSVCEHITDDLPAKWTHSHMVHALDDQLANLVNEFASGAGEEQKAA